MAKLLSVAALALLSWTLVGPVPAAAGPTVDLDRPGALQALEQTNPAHALKVSADRAH